VSDKLLTAAELADCLALSTSTVLDWFAGRLPGFKLGRVVRFRESEVPKWLEAQRVGPRPSGRQPEVVACRSVVPVPNPEYEPIGLWRPNRHAGRPSR
jgi:excisionase family DNA binding protein